MAAVAWDAVITYASFGDGTANSTSFVMPRCTGAVSVFLPALDGVATTVSVQTLNPLDNTYSAILVAVPGAADITYTALDNMAESTVIVIPASFFGPGNFRLVASAVQTTAAKATIIFDRLK